MSVSPARVVAFKILRDIAVDEGLSSELLAGRDATLSERDGALCHALVLGTLRRQIFLDRLIDVFTRGKMLDIEVRIALRLGLFQLMDLDRVPDHAAISESVDLVRMAKRSSAAGLVNAILRRTTRERPKFDFTDDLDRISVETSHPRELLEHWERQFGLERTASIAAKNNEAPRIAFRRTLSTADGDLDALLASGVASPSSVVPEAFVAERSSPEILDRGRRGEIYIQDEASQLVAAIAARLAKANVLDLCASPGSKTGAIALWAPQVVKISATDISKRRVSILNENLERQGVLGVTVAALDGETELPFPESSFDTILVDAPCSGTGTIRHNPEIRYRFKEEELSRYAERQFRLLANAAKYVAPGGHIVYSTCSLEREENEDVIERFLSFDTLSHAVAPPLSSDLALEGDFLRTRPDKDEMDGFFVAVLERRF